MGQKINPVSLRLHYTNRNFDSCWYSKYFYKNLVVRDVVLQQYLDNFLKLLQLPSGRYSIQHLQKKTRIYPFLCTPKKTREWKFKVFGLKKKSIGVNKTRYFFKNKIKVMKFFKHEKFQSSGNIFQSRKYKTFKNLNLFYKTLDQSTLYKIKKKITSFQNFQLWSQLLNQSLKKTVFQNRGVVFQQNSVVSNWRSFEKNGLLMKKLYFFKQKQHFFSNNQQFDEKNRYFFQSDVLKKSAVFVKKKKSMDYKIQGLNLYNREINNRNLFFLQNLFVYKKLKSSLYNKKNGFSRTVNSLIVNKNLWYQFPIIQKSLSVFHPLDFKYKNYIESNLSRLYQLEIDCIPFLIKNEWQHANFLADEIKYFLEKRIPFRRLKNKIIQQLSKIPEIRGVRITCSGRVGGKSKKAQRAKTDCIKFGQTSLHVFSGKIDFSAKTAFTSFGCVGVKVWICYN
jgi:ribosomal protein S3